MDLARMLTEERRARLSAERLLEQKQAQLQGAYRKLDQHARQLSQKVHESRAEVEEFRSMHARVTDELGEATERIEEVEGRLWQALTTIRDGFAMYDGARRLEIANPAYLDLFDGVETVAPGADWDHVLDILVEEGVVDLEGEDGGAWRQRMRHRWTMTPIPDETLRLWNGQFVKLSDRHRPGGGIVTLAIDITEQMRMWSAIEELPDGFVLYDADDRLLMCNQPYRQIYAASAPAIRPGASFEDILRYGLENGQYPDAVGREAVWLEERLAQHRSASQEIEQQLRDGRWLRVYERETRDGGRVGLRVDITQIKRNQERLAEATRRAEAANRAKSTFLANMSHEIRTPMNGVVGMADLMMDTALTEDQRTFVDTIRSSGEALLVIINDILDYSKIEADRLALHPEPFDLEKAIHEVLMLLQPSAREKGLSLLADYDMFLPTRFVGDPGRIRQILTNLIGNAVKFTASGHVRVGVIGAPGAGPDIAVHLTVEDTGIGIPAHKVDHVFGEFNQVEDERNRSFEGTGLGLAITRRLVELMEGEIWVESEPGRGSCFGLRIPLPPVVPQDLLSARLPEELRRVLVADAGGAHREILAKQLAVFGLEPVFCDTADDALALLSDPVDLMLIEDTLPDTDGMALARAAFLRRPGLPVILLSDRPSGAGQAGGAPIHAVLQKPVSRRALLAAMESIGTARPAARKTTEPGPAAAPPGARLDVLVAEDNRTNQLVFRKMAAGFDVDLRFAGNGQQAVDAFRERRPDIIFMDISMPVMDGREATARIRAIEDGGPAVPIVAVTAHAMAGDRETILEAGLDDYLTKPLRKAELSRILERYGAAPARPAVS